MLTFRCTNACRHCLYRCSPRHEDIFMSEETIDRTFEALSTERRLYGIHLAGGEATMNWERLLYAIESARRYGVTLDYLETNASWCEDEPTARAGFERLRHAGLPGVLISASLFHNEFTPLAYTKVAIRAAVDIFGHSGVLVWTTEVLGLMDRGLDSDKPHTLTKACELLDLQPERGDLWRLHNYLRPGGRAAERLTDGLARHAPDAFEGDSCHETLSGTSHFHLDPSGNLFTGHCPGVSVADISDLHPKVSETTAPLFCELLKEGPVGIWREFADDFMPDSEGYVSKCHLCLEVRKHLRERRHYAELRPDEFYQPW